MFYLASRYEERVEKVFESRVTLMNAWKSARVQRLHVRQEWACERTSGARAGHAGVRQGSRLAGVHASTRLCAGSTSFAVIPSDQSPDMLFRRGMRRSSHSTVSSLSYIVKRPNSLNQDGFHITVASYHLEDDLGKCPSMRFEEYENRMVPKMSKRNP
ncbi:hypothetical protein CDL15_Pgr022211 [Punica granatum]|uniref:Uncharacterized protein n=1 Tax=Punica granatum TaxID=22663 RepID=A0A218XR30_PUNGR|nr:hypothetical protein CDL15_Pgr022211 [Punica granatum]